MRKATKLSIFVVLLAAIGGGWYYNAQHSKSTSTNAASKGKDKPAIVTFAVVKAVPFTSTLNLSGTVTPISQVEVRPQITGMVKVVHVQEGSMVKKGQLLFTLDNSEEATNRDKLAAQLAKDQATLADARRSLNRQIELAKQQFVSQSAVDTARSTLDEAAATVKADQAALAGSHVSLDYYRITAPADGRIGQINVHPGSLIQPSSTNPMTTLTQLSPIQVAFNVPETRLNDLHQAWQQAKSQSAELHVNASTAPKPSIGKLVFLDTTVDSTSGSLKAKAEFDNTDQRFWPGAQVPVSLDLSSQANTPVVPAEAVQTGPESTFLYVVGADKKAKALPVKVIEIRDGIAALSGVTPGTMVVKDGGQNVRPGGFVQEAKKRKEGAASGRSTVKAGSNE
ncbi:efflux RND transporter periplasmic adaptor subunit [Leeia sp. TBRC 13508]|uniref:Efflux RND transporter periplasmic adaptor subunit n=1 Tax=Leeia speluncae TaxID=2884804 RepID=A0ABS8D3M1_9NEIS|nr:efflux RND transporter periplasmic adaptor subunit [Leeia speluncae]MCB6182781.1 efflux RND transporter periplasmic adaptor subunit [Leeia speluncae]